MNDSNYAPTVRWTLGIVAVLCCALVSGIHAHTAATTVSSAPTFRVPDQDVRQHWTVIAYGDTRFTDPNNVIAVDPKVRRWLVEKIADENPDAILLSGDLPYTGSDAGDYAVFSKETKIWRDRRFHFYPTLGNHEFKGGEDAGLLNWWKAFPDLEGRRWYSVRFQNAYFILLDSDAPLNEGSEQRNWFASQIAHLPIETKFVFVVQHHPPIADLPMDPGHTPQPNEVDFANYVEQQAKKLPVRFIVVAGHIHNYERFHHGEVDFLVSGGGGARPHPVPRGEADLYKDSAFPNYHYVKFAFDGKQVNATMVRLADSTADQPQWAVKDSFVVGLPGSLVATSALH